MTKEERLDKEILDLKEKVVKLEILVSELQFTNDKLDTIITTLQLENIEIHRKFKLLRDYLKNQSGSNIALESEEVPPPHY